MVNMKIGLLSGTFDPVHFGHITIASLAHDELSLDQIWLMPEEKPRGKQNVTPYHHRLAMLMIVAQDSPYLEVIEVDDEEHSVETLRSLSAMSTNDYYILVGGDVADSINSWKDIDEIRKLAKIVVIGRDSQKADITLRHPASSKDIRKQLAEDKSPPYLDPRVLEYIHEHDLYQS